LGLNWISTQADPNYINNECKPAIATGVSLGDITSDGENFTTLSGDMVFKSYIDSVQNFDDGAGGWDWELYGDAPFDNDSTIGISTNARSFAVVDAPVGFENLNSVWVQIMDFTERNGVAVPDWKLGGFYDNDVVVDDGGAFDTVYYDHSISTGWVTTDLGVGYQSSFTVIPFGCGYPGMLNSFNMEREQSATNSNAEWDSLYFYMSMAPNTVYGHDASDADDGDGFHVYATHDFDANGSFSVALATGYHINAANSTNGDEILAPTAHLLNKMLGFGRGDVNNDGGITLGDIVYLAEHVSNATAGPVPFAHVGDVDNSGGIDNADVTYLVDYYFNMGACPMGDWVL